MNFYDFFNTIGLTPDGTRVKLVEVSAASGEINVSSGYDFFKNINITSNELDCVISAGTGTILINSQKDFYQNIKLTTDGKVIVSSESPTAGVTEVNNQYDYFNKGIELTSEGYLKVINVVFAGSSSNSNQRDYYKNVSFSGENLNVSIS